MSLLNLETLPYLLALIFVALLFVAALVGMLALIFVALSEASRGKR